jgi:hypothetical protein
MGKVRPNYLEVSAQSLYPFILLPQVRIVFSFTLPLRGWHMSEREYINVGFNEPDIVP